MLFDVFEFGIAGTLYQELTKPDQYYIVLTKYNMKFFEQMEKQLFVAEVLRELYIDSKNSYCELAIVIIKASSFQEAESAAEQFGQSQKRSYTNADGGTVNWKFVRVVSINPALCEEIGDATEVHCQMYKDIISFESAGLLQKFEGQ